MTSEYERLARSRGGTTRRFRRVLPEEERQRRAEQRAQRNRRNMEARRRAMAVMQDRHPDEWRELFTGEWDALDAMYPLDADYRDAPEGM